MRMYFIESADGEDKFIFAFTGDRAAQQFVAWQILNSKEACDFSVERVTAASRVEPDATHLREALKIGLEGIGHYDDVSGWTIDRVREEDLPDD